MAWKIMSPALAGAQGIDQISPTQRHAVGTIVQAEDPVYGAGEFIYLLGVAGTVARSWVTYNMLNGQTTLSLPNAIGPLGIAMAANVAGSWGWYQITGYAQGLALSAQAVGGQLYLSSAGQAGSMDDVSVIGDLVGGAIVIVTSSALATYAGVAIQRPYVNDHSQIV